MRHSHLRRALALVLAVVMVLGLGAAGVQAAPAEGQVTVEKLDPSAVSAELIQTGSTIQTQTESLYAETDQVRVMIVLEDEPAIGKLKGSENFIQNIDAVAYRAELQAKQEKLADTISRQALQGQELDVVWNLTLMANAIAANVTYGSIDEIAQIQGVEEVYLETMYYPQEAQTNNIVAQEMTGADVAQNTYGYTGAGSRIAVVDTGTDPDHQSFSAAGFEHSLAVNAEAAGMGLEEYMDSLDLLDAAAIEAVLPQLNASQRYEGLTAQDLYLNSKMPFNFNYVDGTLNVSHDLDDQGSHGSHVAGIAAANRYISTEKVCDFDGDGDSDLDDAQLLMDHVILGTEAQNLVSADLDGDDRITDHDVQLVLDALNGDFYADAAELVGVTGVAPDAQLITMKVFGVSGGAYSSDYMAATEDAVLLGCDSVNLSLGAANPGFASAHEGTAEETAYVDGLMEALEDSGIIMCVSAGNSGNWADYDEAYQMMYADEGGTYNTSEPATYANALSVASADNVGLVTDRKTWFTGANGTREMNLEAVGDGVNADWITMDPNCTGASFEIVFVGDPTALLSGGEQTDLTIYGGNVSDFVDVEGKIVLVARGNQVSFADKHSNAALAGAAGVLIYNNVSDPIYASIEGSEATIPCGTITLAQAIELYSLFQEGKGTFHVRHMLNVDHGGQGEQVQMSDFSSWGSTGSLSIKPEITAPGGNIYSVNGVDPSGTAYEQMSGTSMSSPHVAGLAALASQFIADRGLAEKTGLSQRVLGQSLMMSTAEVLMEGEMPYSVRNQGAGLASIENMILADTYVMVDGQSDGKVKAELGDGTEDRSFTFTLNNLTDADKTYNLSAQMMTTGTTTIDGYSLSTDTMVELPAQVTFSTGDAVTVPANGSAAVTVTVAVSQEAAAEMEAKGYTNGFYIEGFVYATAVADAEGTVGASHSIPLLGWYGSWTDPSMYEANEHIDFAYDTLERPAHMNDYSTNILSWCPLGYGSGMYYSGNIYGSIDTNTGAAIGDSRYIEARNAINSTDEAQWELFAIYPTLIRNAADYKLTIYDSETGEVYYFNDYESQDDYLLASFYYMIYGQWYNTTTESPVDLEGWDVTDLEGNPLPEGTSFTIELACAPDYYVRGDGTVDWSQVGEGAYLRHSFQVDNTDPELVEGSLKLDGDTLSYTVRDNNYIAAVILLTGDASAAVSYHFPDMDENQRGQSVTGTLDLSGYQEMYGSKAAIAVCDYAGNESYYAINLGGEGASYGDLVAFRYDASGYPGSWVSFSEGVAMNETGLFPSDVDFVAAEYVGGMVFAQDDSGNLYGIEYADMLADSVNLEQTFITRLDIVYQDFAYNYFDGKLYGLSTTEDGDGYPTTEVYTINLRGAYYDENMWTDVAAYQEDWATSRGGVYGLAMAIDDTGSVYVLGSNYDWDAGEVTGTAHLWKASMEEDRWMGMILGAFTDLGDTGMGMDYLQSMTWDHNTETLYWAQFYPEGLMSIETNLVKIDPATAACEIVGELSFETSAMFAPLTAESAAKTEHANVPAFDASVIPTPMLSMHELTMGVGKTDNLTVTFDPWYSADKAVVWSSSDESVVTVDQNGRLTAVGEGSCTVTVCAANDESKFDACQITVASLSLNINGIVSRSEGGINNVWGAKLYNYSMDKGLATMTEGELITAPEEFQGYGLNIASAVEARGSIWACEYGNSGMIYEIDKQTGVVKDMLLPVDGDIMYGMSYSESTDLFTGIMNFYLYVDLPMNHEMEQEIQNSYDEELFQFTWHKFDMSEYLQASDEGFMTGETGQGSMVDVVFCGITTVDNTDGESYYMYGDFTGGGYYESSYTPATTHVILDNVGRLWHIDETVGMTLQTDDYGNRTYIKGDDYVSADTYGVFAQVNSDGTYNVFLIRQIQDTVMTDMYRNGTLPRITYHFSDIYYAGETEDGAPMYFLSMYDYWNNGTTNQLYLYIPGVPNGEPYWDMDKMAYVTPMTPDSLYDLGTTGQGNIIASITSAELISGLPSTVVEEAPQALAAGAYPVKK